MIKCIEASEPEELQLRTISLLATLGCALSLPVCVSSVIGVSS
jgi:hypothetical protein